MRGSLVLSPTIRCKLSVARAYVAKTRYRLYFSSVCPKLFCAADYAETSMHCGLFKIRWDKSWIPTPLNKQEAHANTRCVARAISILSRSVGRRVRSNVHTSDKPLYSTNTTLPTTNFQFYFEGLCCDLFRFFNHQADQGQRDIHVDWNRISFGEQFISNRALSIPMEEPSAGEQNLFGRLVGDMCKTKGRAKWFVGAK